jgi:hypothetical protein
MSPYREFLGKEDNTENKSLIRRLIDYCKLVLSKINFDKIVMYIIIPVAALAIIAQISLLCYGIHQNSIDQVNGTKICGEMQYIKTNHVIKNLDEVECFISLSEGKKIIFVENKDKWILTGN